MTSLFRGMGAPFATVAVYNAILFAARGQMESMLAHADGEGKLVKRFWLSIEDCQCSVARAELQALSLQTYTAC